MQSRFSLFLLAAAMAAGGCSSMKPGSLDDVQPLSDRPRAGNVYLLRGFIGIFSTGIDHLGEEINANGVRALVYQDDQWPKLADTIGKVYAGQEGKPGREPLVLVGHSYGADDVVRVARELENRGVTVDLLVTIDPTTPPNVSKNVARTVNLYRPNGVFDSFPWFRGVPLAADPGSGKVENVNIRTDPRDLMEPGTDHFNIEKKGKIHGVVIAEVLATCPDRAAWTTARNSERPGAPVVRAAPAAPAAANPPTLSAGGTPALGHSTER